MKKTRVIGGWDVRAMEKQGEEDALAGCGEREKFRTRKRRGEKRREEERRRLERRLRMDGKVKHGGHGE